MSDGEFVKRARVRLAEAEANLERGVQAGECDDRIAALRAIVANRKKQLESTIRAELVLPPR